MSSLVPAIDRAIRVLYIFKDGAQKEYGVSEISRLLDINKSTAHNILNTLAYHNFLVREETTRRYRLGPALAELGSVVRSRIDIRGIARPYLRRLMEQTGATILLGILTGATITIVDQEEPFTDVRVAVSVGMKIPFCAGAFGKTFLAYLPTETVDQLLANPGLKAFTATSITDADEYRAALATVRAQGYAIDDNEEYLLDVGAIAVPIFAPPLIPFSPSDGPETKNVVAVITMVNFNSRLSPEKIAKFIPWMVETGREISGKLGVSMSKSAS
jgi:IclR family KDG regulon transcriptional repressor